MQYAGVKAYGFNMLGLLEFVTDRALGQVGGTECVHVSAVSANLASYNYSLVEKSLAAFAILRGRYQESPEAH